MQESACLGTGRGDIKQDKRLQDANKSEVKQAASAPVLSIPLADADRDGVTCCGAASLRHMFDDLTRGSLSRGQEANNRTLS